MDSREQDALDALIAEKVMGWERQPSAGPFPELNPKGYWWRIPETGWGRQDFHPSLFIADAWMVVEKLKALPYAKGDQDPISELRLWWSNQTKTWHCRTWGENFYEAKADTAPEAICLAALKAIETVVPA